MVAGLRLFSERTAEGSGEPIFGDDEESMLVQPAVSIVIGNRPPLSPGTLYISSKKMVWLSDTDRAVGYAVDFLSVSLHAVSRDPEAYPSPCIYAQIETGDGYEDENDDSESSDTESNDVLELSNISEIRFVPSDPTQLDTLFEVFCECAELNPEPIEGEEEEEEEHNWIFSADQVETGEGDESEWNDSPSLTSTIGISNGDHDLTHTVLQLQINDQRFEDAEEMEGDANSSHS